ncbi:MAG: hypothetical protein OES79_08520 [Planctomycetota bacterium]|nr:hypothetical protein [Planctomycetota bacterium]
MASSAHDDSPPAAARASSDDEWRGWWRFGMADLLLLVLVLGIMQRSQGSMLDDPGLGWHLRHVDAMWDAGGWLTQDPFTGPRSGQPWRTNQWLGDLLLYFGWWWGGLEGIAAVTTLVLAFTFRFLYRMLLADRVPWPLALFWTLLAVLGTSLTWVARPNVFTLPLVMLTAWILDRYHRGGCRRQTTWWLVPMFVLWANTHGGFVAGLVIVGTTLTVECVCSLFGKGAAREAALERLRHLACLLPACVAATLVNPYGWSLYPWVFQLLGNEFFMNLHTEWLSPDFHARGAFRFELLMLAFPVLLALGRRRSISLVALCQSVLWLHFALNGQRYVCLWVVVTVPLLARLSVDSLSLVVRWAGGAWRPRPGSLPSATPLGAVLIAAALLAWARWTDGYSRHDPRHIPSAALTYVVQHHAGQVVFHEYGWGGWLVWHGWPSVKNWIDDRNEVQGRAHIEQYLRIMQAREGWQDSLDQYAARVACLPVDSPLAERLAAAAGWQLRYRDDYAVVYENTTGYSEQVARSPHTDPEVRPRPHVENRKLSLLREDH